MAREAVNICVVCTRGKNARIKELQSLLKSSIGNEDENHEVKFLLSQIVNDSTNDTTPVSNLCL